MMASLGDNPELLGAACAAEKNSYRVVLVLQVSLGGK